MEVIQKLIKWAKVLEEKAAKLSGSKNAEGTYYKGRSAAFSDVVLFAELLLDEQQPNSNPQPPLRQAFVRRSLLARHRYLAGKVREHLNAVGYDLSVDTESLITQVLEVDGKFFDENIGCNDA